jgi:hypothetical protein
MHWKEIGGEGAGVVCFEVLCRYSYGGTKESHEIS